MRGTIAAAIVMLCGGPAGMNAFQSQLESEPAHKTVLLTGCLEQANPESAFTLTDATTISRTTPEQVAPSPVGTAGTKGTPETEYELRPVSGVGESGVDGIELGRHIGQRVEITARPIEDTPAAPRSEALPTEQATPRDEAAARIRLTVTALKSLGTPCS